MIGVVYTGREDTNINMDVTEIKNKNTFKDLGPKYYINKTITENVSNTIESRKPLHSMRWNKNL